MFKDVNTDRGPVRGFKVDDDEVFSFFGIPYATAPKGKDRFSYFFQFFSLYLSNIKYCMHLYYLFGFHGGAWPTPNCYLGRDTFPSMRIYKGSTC